MSASPTESHGGPKLTGAPDEVAVAFNPPLLLGVFLVAGFALRWLAPLPFLPPTLALLTGALITAVAVGLWIWTVRTLVNPHALLPTDPQTHALDPRGPYRLSRNPFYLATVLLQVGLGFGTNSLWFLGLAALFATLLWWGVISREEVYLDQTLGDEFTRYRARVRRWI